MILKKNLICIRLSSLLTYNVENKRKNKTEEDRKASKRRSVAIPLTRIHILHRRRAKRGRGTIGYPPFRVSLCYGLESGTASAPQLPKWVRGRATRPAWRDGLAGKETEIGGPRVSIL